MNERERQISKCTKDFLVALPSSVKGIDLGAIVCTIFEGFDLDHEQRVYVCEGILNIMLEADMRKDERAAQAADEFLARAAAKARK